VDLDLFDLHARVEHRHWWFVGRRTIVRRILERVVPAAGRPLIIDVACGTGATAASLADRYETLGIDNSERAVTLARQRFPAVPFIHGEVPGALGATAGRASAFLLMDVLEHIEDDVSFLGALMDVAPPGAQFVITVPADMTLWSAHDEHYGHYRRYDVPRLRHMWRKLPVDERLVSHCNTRLYPAVRAVRQLNRLRGHGIGQSGTDLSLPPAPINAMLARVFSGEAGRLAGLLDNARARPYSRGLSLIAVLQRRGARSGAVAA
jgi:2-polyprenyl-3-methyl-5-hydroxy-6-metoxy-1,4-benzoquinol methylase